MAHRIRIEPVGREIVTEKGTILDACLRQGIWLPHACTHGTCGTCKARVVEGTVDFGDASVFALMDFEREDGYALLCQATPLTDVVIEADVDVEPGIEYPVVEDFRAVVHEIVPASPSVRVVRLLLDRPFRALPGQYFHLQIPRTQSERAYSIANLSNADGLLELHIKYSPQGIASEWMFQACQIGDEVGVSGPYGRFVLRPASPEPIVFLAGGTGWAPIKAMLLALLQRNPDHPVTLIFGARTLAELYDHDWLREMAKTYPAFQYIPAVSDEIVDDMHIARGRVDEVVKERFPKLSGYKAYVAGPPPMVEACVAALYERRL
ncbi:MAG: 2Fe-2S iron-sulfur cluster-binding protein, partial [Sulfobacillus thermotolerans]|nr:2Fe-2S iron-sulfur cluster-binding protein [Sulfobacillus thermotolerans]